MFRLILLLAGLLAAPAWAADLPPAPPLFASPTFKPVGPRQALGALVWLHGTYDRAASGPPEEPDLIARLAHRGFDIWRFDRARGTDRLDAGAAGLAQGLAGLRKAGYRRVLVAGHSRGAWIALSALAHAGLADGIISVSPAAFGRGPERQAEAMASWKALWQAAALSHTRVVLVQLRDDPYDPAPRARRDIAETESRRAGLRLLPVFLPEQPLGHVGMYEPEFDEILGAKIAGFVEAR